LAIAISLGGELEPRVPQTSVGVERTPTPSVEEKVAQAAGLPQAREPLPSPEPDHVLRVDGLRVSVARLGIDLPLALGDLDRDVPHAGFAGATPENSAFVYPGSRSPGDGGNTYIYAHARPGMFLALWGVRIGDTIAITDTRSTETRSYRVEVIAPRVDPSDTHWLDPSGVERITLQTSTGPGPGDPRFIVVAYPVPG
jgi:hypothetical protein